jgi:hypothetical protein
VTTAIHDAQHNVITEAPAGTVVHDQATVAGDAAVGTPTGTVAFTVYSDLQCSGGATPAGTVALVNGVAEPSDTAPQTSAGISFRAHYTGDTNYAAADSVCEPLSAKAPTTTAITSDTPDPSAVGQAVVVNFTVTSASGTPTGNVTVSDGAGTTCTGALAGGAGSCTLTSTCAGAKTLTATYAGDANFNGSTSAGEGHTVNKANTTTTLTFTPSSAHPGEVVTFVATVTAQAPGAGTPTGSVMFKSYSNVIPGCNAVPLNAAGQATCITSLRPMTAEYSGDTCFNVSTDTLKLQPVGGYLVPVRRAELWAPWLGLALLALVIAAVVVRKRVA